MRKQIKYKPETVVISETIAYHELRFWEKLIYSFSRDEYGFVQIPRTRTCKDVYVFDPDDEYALFKTHTKLPVTWSDEKSQCEYVLKNATACETYADGFKRFTITGYNAG